MIHIENVTLTIKNKEILKDVNMYLEAGKIHGLVGRNGSGKTMLMKCICGFVRTTAGKILVDGMEIGKDTDFTKDTGVIIETPGFISHKSGFENLKILAGCRKVIDTEEIKKAISLMGLDPDDRLPVKKYSLGMRQRLGIAQAVMEKPKLLVLDEPFNGLDEEGVTLVREILLAEKERGATIILSSHNAGDIFLLCDTVHRASKGIFTKEK